MVCLLCLENGESISLSSDESVNLNIPSILFKYFKFMFESEPDSLNAICRKCWLKVEMFHTFFEHIKEIQTTIITSQPIVVGNLEIYSRVYKVEKDFSIESIDNNISDSNSYQDEEADTTEFFTEMQSEHQMTETVKNGSVRIETNKQLREPESRAKRDNVPRNGTSEKHVNRENCPINRKCVQTFGTREELLEHCALEHKRFHCTHCPNIRVFSDLYKHLREVHGIIENAICEHCGRTFSCNRTLQDHIRRKHTISDPVQCDICKAWFKSRDTIRSHMNYVHVQGPQTCKICGKVSVNQKALRTHLTIHSDAWKDKFKCVACGRGFRSSTKLREHSYIHSGKTDAYICQFCGKSFRFNSSISAHRMKYHPVEMAHVKERLRKRRNKEYKI